MNHTNIYKPKSFNLSGLKGISDETLEVHFKLYEGYVKQVNHLNEKLAECVEVKKNDPEKFPEYAEIRRRLGFEYNGMILHEYYFENLTKNGEKNPPKKSNFSDLISSSFGSYENWKKEFTNVGKMRGVGWAICYQDPHNENLSNHWITLHEVGNVASFKPIVVMDIWEHAYLLDYKPSEKAKYIESFFSNINWDVVEDRLHSLPLRGDEEAQ